VIAAFLEQLYRGSFEGNQQAMLVDFSLLYVSIELSLSVYRCGLWTDIQGS